MAETDGKYPECERVRAVSDQSQGIGEFLEWCQEEGYVLASFDEATGTCWPIRKRIEQLLADYFEIDLVKVEAERRAMLAEIRDKLDSQRTS